MKKTFISIIVLAMVTVVTFAQVKTTETGTSIDGVVELDKTVHDFGDVITGSGPLTCEFSVKNLSNKAMAIYNVAVSCGCTDAQWTREPIQPGKTGVISVVYNNNDGPYPFDKNLTVYFSNVKKPFVLKLRGVAHEKDVPIGERFPVHLGNLGLKEMEIKGGNVTQGSQKSDVIIVANIGKTPMKLSFEDLSKNLELFVENNPVPAGQTTKLRFNISTDRSHWGKTWYYATPVVNGVKEKPIAIWAFSKEDFSTWTEAQRAKAAVPIFDTNTFNFGTVKEGEKVEAEFSCKNSGKEDFVVYKIDSDWPKTTVTPIKTIASNKSGTYKISVDTTGMPEGEAMVIITMTTNTPNRPLVNLFIGGAVKK